jgi:hypothetical protein
MDPAGALTVVDVVDGGAAARCGLTVGDELLAIAGRPVGELIENDELRALLDQPGPVALRVRRGTGTLDLELFPQLIADEPTSQVSVPMLLFGRVPVIEVAVEGHGTLPFVLDTEIAGARLHAPLAEEWGLEIREVESDGGQEGGGVERSVALDGLSVAGHALVETNASLEDLSEYRFDGRTPAGVLGLAAFGNSLVTLDYPGQRFELSAGALPEADGERVLDYFVCKGQSPAISVEIGGYLIDVHVASAAWGAFRFPDGDLELLETVAEPSVIGSVVRPDGRFQIRGAVIAGEGRIGSHRITRPRAHFSDGFGHAGIGHGVLNRFAVTFDPVHQRVRFREGPSDHAGLYERARTVARLGDGPGLTATFDEDRDKVRLIVLVSPT